LIQSRLEFKILLLLIGVLLLGFGSYVIITIESDSRAMLNQERDKVRVSSDWLMEGIRSVMLTGKAPIASEFVNDCRQNFKQADVTIFDRFGREVFLREGEGTRRDVNNPSVNDVLQNSKTLSTMTRQGTAGLFTRYEPLLNRPECWRCHDRREVLRGVLQVALNPVVLNVENDALRQMESSIGNIIATAFRTIMLGGNGEQMDTLIAAVKEIPGVSLTQVYDRKGSLHFGPDVAEIPADRITQLLKMRPIESHFEEFGRKFRLLVPLENQERCQVCHGSKQEMRGVLVLEFSADTLRKYLRDPQKMFTPVLQKAAFEGFRSIMLVGRANCVRFFIDELRTEPVLRSISVFDRAGNERFLNPPARKLEHLKEIVDSLKPIEMMRSVNGNEFFVRLVPLLNEDRCHSCHGATHKVRGIVEISASMKEINDHIRDNEYRSAGIGAITIFFVWMVIRFFMKSLVVGPVLGIEDVAARVGKGDFTAQAKIGSLDEIGSLAKRINQMVNELREKFHLQKFVSQQTVDAVKKSTIEGIKLGGERKSATVFFSDIRGFTAYSEKFEPERVVSMLNRCLSTQAMIIKEFGGDIDKYVGDELVAVFEGTDMVRRAVLAAIKIQKELLKRVHLDDKATIKIGIGINTGEMIMGAMGSEERMDYTVIGDSVNLGARLCSAAEPGQILLSHMSAQHIPNDPELRLRRLDPISVKGKERSVDVYEVIL
jgi:class 3 adenylate cyclase